ncbi:TonB-dependent receptor [Kangiella shandongensis]|uniref:TonB-dependent receptor n=1 Tax=Kangiella shandongensis TaxID=2763258 RepID=UPI001CBB0B0F|nr:TonB-dependent receptor [Kangiella shandongensis]
MKKTPIYSAVVAVISSVLTLNTAVAEDSRDTEILVVSATRAPLQQSAVPATVTIIDGTDIRQQLSVSNSLSDILGNLLPSFSPSRQKLTSSGETLRGRTPLYLIDGVPQSNPLRNGSRSANTIDPMMIERVEVIHGASAIQGLGASGGIINIITKTAQSGTEHELTAGIGAPTSETSEGMSYDAGYLVSHGEGQWQFVAGVHLRETGMYVDGNGELIGVDTTQGDTMDSSSQDIFGKVIYQFNNEQQLQLMLNHFELASNGDYSTLVGDRAAGIPATSVRGDVEGDPAENEVTTVSLNYSDADWMGADLKWQLFSQSFSALYGGGRFATFQDPEYGDDLYDQSRNDSNKLGSRLTLNWQQVADTAIDMTGGFDFLRDRTFQELAQTGRKWVPETDFENWAPFLQARLNQGAWSFSAGLRYEYGKLKVDDFTTLASYNNSFVKGGEPSFNELLTNFGVVYEINDEWRAFVSVSEAFSMPDVGRVLRGINQPDLSVDSFLNLQPVLSDNNEIGVEYLGEQFSFAASYFESDSDLGARLSPNADGIYEVNREKTEIHGFELSAEYGLADAASLGLLYADNDGEFDSDDDGVVDAKLGGRNIAPRRLNLFWQHDWTVNVNSRLQWNTFFDRDIYQGADAINNFDGYSTVDYTLSMLTQSAGEFTLGLENLLDEEYFTYYAQTAGNDARNFRGRGRTVRLNWSYSW